MRKRKVSTKIPFLEICFTDSEKQHIFVGEYIVNDIRLWHMSIFIMHMRIIDNTYV